MSKEAQFRPACIDDHKPISEPVPQARHHQAREIDWFALQDGMETRYRPIFVNPARQPLRIGEGQIPHGLAFTHFSRMRIEQRPGDGIRQVADLGQVRIVAGNPEQGAYGQTQFRRHAFGVDDRRMGLEPDEQGPTRHARLLPGEDHRRDSRQNLPQRLGGCLALPVGDALLQAHGFRRFPFASRFPALQQGKATSQDGQGRVVAAGKKVGRHRGHQARPRLARMRPDPDTMQTQHFLHRMA